MPKKSSTQNGKITKCFNLIQKTTNIIYTVGRYRLRNNEIYFNHDPTGLISLARSSRTSGISTIVGVNKYYCGACSHIPTSLQKLFVTDHHIIVPFYRIESIHLEIFSMDNKIYRPIINRFTLGEFLRNKSRYLSILSDDFYPWLLELIDNDAEIFNRMRISSPSVSLYSEKEIYSLIKSIKNEYGVNIDHACDLLIESLKSINKKLILGNKFESY